MGIEPTPNPPCGILDEIWPLDENFAKILSDS